MVSSPIVEALTAASAQSVRSGQQSELLTAAAQEHAQHQADTGRCGHQGFSRRLAELRPRLPADCQDIREVAAASFPGVPGEYEGAVDCVDGWQKSDGHWAIVNGPCRLWGYGLAYSERAGRWFAAGLVAGGSDA
jgi:uncharacterized protein YkwD